MTRPLAAWLALPLLLAACAIGDPIIPGQRAQSCVNEALGLSAPPPQYVRVGRDAIPGGYDAWYSRGTVALGPGARGGRLAAHEAARQATWTAYGRQPTEAEFTLAERRCDAPRLPRRQEILL